MISRSHLTWTLSTQIQTLILKAFIQLQHNQESNKLYDVAVFVA